MRVHFSSVVAIFVTLLFVSGTVGCRSNGGDWYNPKSYSWTNPFAKEGQDSGRPRSPDAFANTKPSLDEHPNISIPPGGYSGEASLANRSTSPAGTLGGSTADPWGQQNSVASHIPPSHLSGLSGYTVAEPSPYPPAYMVGMVGDHSVATAHQQQQHIPQEMAQQHHMPYGPSDYVQTGFHQPVNNASVYHHPVQHAPAGIPAGIHGSGVHGGMEPQGNYAPFGMSQSDPYAAIHQPVAVPPTGFGFEQQPAQMQQSHYQPGFPGDGGFHHQPHHQPQPHHLPHHQPQPANAFPPGGVNHW